MYAEIEDEDIDDVDAPPREAPAAARRAVTLERIETPRNDWLWANRIAVGHLTLVAGPSGGGKSLFAADLAARVSNGAAWPGETNTRPAGKVLFAQSHRHENGVLKRRLLAAGADERRVAVVTRPPIALGTPPVTLARKLVETIEKSLDDKPGETPNMAALPEVGSLAPAVVQVELRRDAVPNVAALLEVGSLATREG